MEEKMEQFYNAWMFLQEHPKFRLHDVEVFPEGLSTMVVKINPVTEKIEDYDEDLDARDPNTKVQIWLEYGPWTHSDELDDMIGVHDMRLDCGGDTFEDAIIELAKLVKEHYGEYTQT